MDLIERVRRWAVGRPRVLVVDAPGTANLRWTVEAELDRRGWPLALSPAGADLLLVVGAPGEELAQAVDVVWSQVPGPRHRAGIRTGNDVAPTLDAVVKALAEAAERGQPGDDERPRPGDLLEQRGSEKHGDHAGMDHAGMDHQRADPAGADHAGMGHDAHGEHAGMDHGGMDHGGMDHGGMDHGGHGGMDVAGLPMADTAPDRDGLQLDALQVSLGPVLAGWPTGLLLRGQLQGDVLGDVTLTWTDADTGDEGSVRDSDDARLLALDRLARLLEVAGWPTAARDARRARDRLRSADPAEAEEAHRVAVQLTRRVRRSRTLAWSVRGIGVVDDADAWDLDGDVLDRARRWCEMAAAPETSVATSTDLSLERLAHLLDGAELAAARLVVASLPLSHPATRRQPVNARV